MLGDVGWLLKAVAELSRQGMIWKILEATSQLKLLDFILKWGYLTNLSNKKGVVAYPLGWIQCIPAVLPVSMNQTISYMGFDDLTNWDSSTTKKHRHRQTGLMSCGSFTVCGELIGKSIPKNP